MNKMAWHNRVIKRKMILTVGLLTLISLASAETVYQVTQPSGQVSVTDNIDTAYQLSGGNTQNIKILDNMTTLSNLDPASTATMPPATPNTTQNPPNAVSQALPALPETLKAQTSKITQKGTYRLQLITPEPNMVYHRPAQTIDISVRVSPSLQAGDSIAYSIDGKKIAQTQDLTLTIGSQEVPLDKHTLQIEVLNVLNQPIASIQDDFYVTQNTIAIQKRRKLEQLKQQLEAYDDLTWYQKLAVRLGIQKK